MKSRTGRDAVGIFVFALLVISGCARMQLNERFGQATNALFSAQADPGSSSREPGVLSSEDALSIMARMRSARVKSPAAPASEPSEMRPPPGGSGEGLVLRSR